MSNPYQSDPQYTFLNPSTSGNSAVVTPAANQKVLVLDWSVVATGTVNVKWQSGGSDVTSLTPCVVNSGKVSGYCPVGWFETLNAGDVLNINLSTNVAVGIDLVYVLINV